MDSRLFLGLWPDPRQRNQLRDILRPLLTTIEGKAVDRHNWHVTLVFIGEFPQDRVPGLLTEMSQIEVQPFRLRFDRVTFWPRPKIACLQAMRVPDELKQLKSDLENMLTPYAVAPETHEYRPHITAVRTARAFDPIRLARPLELQWSSFDLIESVPMPGGVQYRPLKQ